jgi:hypothetical protein
MTLQDALELIEAHAGDAGYRTVEAAEARRVHEQVARCAYMAEGLAALLAGIKPRMDAHDLQAELAERLPLLAADVVEIATALADYARAVLTVQRAHEGG